MTAGRGGAFGAGGGICFNKGQAGLTADMGGFHRDEFQEGT